MYDVFIIAPTHQLQIGTHTVQVKVTKILFEQDLLIANERQYIVECVVEEEIARSKKELNEYLAFAHLSLMYLLLRV